MGKAADIGMVVNCKKTQIICFSLDNGYTSKAAILIQGQEIEPLDSMKLLGYHIGNEPGVHAQVEAIKTSVASGK